LRTCIESLKKTTYKNYSVLIVDNESDDQATLRFMANCGHRVLRVNTGGKFSFAAVNNRAAEACESDFVLLLNNDTEVIEPRWLSRMMGYAQLAGIGAVGARLLYPDGRVQHAGVMHGLHHGLAGHAFKLLPRWDHGYLSHAKLARNYMAVTAACLLTPRKLFLDHGGLDETTFAVAYNDCDYCYKLIDEGFRCVYVAGAELLHYEGLSRGFNDDPREVMSYRQKHGRRIDAYYSPHLSLEDERFRIQPRRLVRAAVPKIRTAVFSHMLNFTGAPLIQYEVAQALAGRGVIEPVLACVPDGPLRQSYAGFCSDIHILGDHPLAPVLGHPDSYDAAMESLGRRMKDEWKIELLYANTLDTVFAVEAASRVGIPVVWNVHESEGWREYFARYGVLLARRCLENFARPYRVIFGSDATRKVYEAWNSAHNFTTIRNPLSLDRLCSARSISREEARASLGVDESDIVLLTVGTVCPRKGQLDLVHAIARLPAELRKRVRCYLVGDRPSPYSSEIVSALQNLGDGLAARTTLVPETDDVLRYYRAGDIFVCSSRIECYPRVTQEAMAAGLPIVTTPVFGIAEQVREGINAIFYPPGNVQQLAAALGKILADDSLRRSMADAAPNVLNGQVDFDGVIDQYAQIFQEAFLTRAQQ
ncbi:MAG TPA: glycosyltransferase, partial [Tepidisphaeraceae bacterium]|nr:glycosyltransferase [Tepidisphaeraceae bacterium]